jgi:hypothetical protein
LTSGLDRNAMGKCGRIGARTLHGEIGNDRTGTGRGINTMEEIIGCCDHELALYRHRHA